MSIKIAVDAGHGSATAGKRTPAMPHDVDFEKDGKVDVKKGSPIREHAANVGVCVFLAEELERCKFDVFKSAWDDADWSDDPDVALTVRQEVIKKAGCEYSVSVHFNAAGDGASFNNAKGVCIYYHAKNPGDSKKLAQTVQDFLVQGTKQTDRGINADELALVNCPRLGTKASILVECAFMTNLEEAELMGDVRFWRECAVEIAKGFCAYLGVDYIPDVPVKKIYKVQVEGGSTREIAETMVKKLDKLGFTTKVVSMKKGSKVIFRVQVGAFSVKSNADLLVKRLNMHQIVGLITEE